MIQFPVVISTPNVFFQETGKTGVNLEVNKTKIKRQVCNIIAINQEIKVPEPVNVDPDQGMLCKDLY